MNSEIARGDLYFNACDIGFILGYRNVPRMLRSHLLLKRTIDDLIDVVTLIPNAKDYRLINFEEIPDLQARVSRPQDISIPGLENVESGKLSLHFTFDNEHVMQIGVDLEFVRVFYVDLKNG
ncbi:hypothetical protein NPIL_349571 [Nephila pilipes]|uniref:Uncharacterized protein n=1 Tax=Nephila pilipes TaxID=299642 RepID=A0A8X6U1U8_NEPPI|nr:hypothetical protein NPIL_349571 [Nephila pilipes]